MDNNSPSHSEEKKAAHNKKLLSALAIGFLVGVFFMGVAAVIYKKNTAGIISMLICGFLIFKIVKGNKQDKKTN